jgi:hypothetical protein
MGIFVERGLKGSGERSKGGKGYIGAQRLSRAAGHARTDGAVCGARAEGQRRAVSGMSVDFEACGAKWLPCAWRLQREEPNGRESQWELIRRRYHLYRCVEDVVTVSVIHYRRVK